MKTKNAWILSLGLLGGMLAVGAAHGQSAPPGPAADDGGICFASLAAPMSTAGPICGSCAGQCRSDGQCKGKLAGDVCNASGGTCQTVGGCGMFDCCRCTNAFAALAPAGRGGER